MHARIAYKAALITKSKKRILNFYYKNICFSSFLFKQMTKFQAFSCFAVTHQFQRRKRKRISIAIFLYSDHSPVLFSQLVSQFHHCKQSPRQAKLHPANRELSLEGTAALLSLFTPLGFLSLKSVGTALQFLASYDLAFACKFFLFFFFPSEIGFSLWSHEQMSEPRRFPSTKSWLILCLC